MSFRPWFPALAFAVLGLACGGGDAEVDAEDPGAASSGESGATDAAAIPGIDKGDGLVLEVLSEGQGVALRRDHDVKLHYRGFFAGSEAEFDSSYSRHQPFTFTLGRGPILKGWHKGLVGVRVGSQVRLHVPAALAYGEAGNSFIGIPPNQDLVFDFHVLAAQ